MQLEATLVGHEACEYVVRPKGQLGTCGFYPKPWAAVFVTARNKAEAVRRAIGKLPANWQEKGW